MAQNYSVFLVDDDKFALDMYSRKFLATGATVDVASGSKEALEKLRGGANPDIMVLDIIMPEMDGLELLDVIRKENLAEKSAVVMLTNETSEEKKERAKKLGAKGYIVKATCEPSELAQCVFDAAQIKK